MLRKALQRVKQLICALLYGIPTTVKLLSENRETYYYIPHVGMGDYCVALGYLKEFRTYYGIKHITLVLTKERKEICGYYDDYDSIKILSKNAFTGLVFIASLPVIGLIHLCCKRIINVSYTLFMRKSLLNDNPALHVTDCTKIILKIPSNSSFTKPNIPQANINYLVNEYSLEKGKTVLINPFTSGVAVRELDEAFYLSLVDRLEAIGLKPVTILGNSSQKPVPKTKGIVSSLSEAWALAQWCGWIVGTRSGFFDLMQYSSDCKIFVVYDSGCKQSHFFSLNNAANSQKIFEYTCGTCIHDTLDQIIKKIVELNSHIN